MIDGCNHWVRFAHQNSSADDVKQDFIYKVSPVTAAVILLLVTQLGEG